MPGQRPPGRGADFAGQPLDRAGFLDVADEDGLPGQRGGERGLARLRAHAVEHPGPLLLQRAADEPGHALAVGDPEDEEGLAAELEKIAHGLGFRRLPGDGKIHR